MTRTSRLLRAKSAVLALCPRPLVLSAVVCLVFGLAGAAVAQNQDGETTTPQKKSIFKWIYDAEGIFFFPQLGISIGVVALITSNVLGMRRTNFIPPEFVPTFEAHVKEKKFKEAFEHAKKDESLLGRLVSTGLQRLSVGYSEAIGAMQELGEDETMKFEHRLSYLALIGNVATLVGLLGTVWGMVVSFMVIGASDVAPKPSVLAQGVSQALVTTVVGLLQAIPAIIFFTVLKNRLDRLVLEVGVSSEQLMQPFKTVAVRRPTEASQGATVTTPGSV